MAALARRCYPNFNLQYAEAFARRVFSHPDCAAFFVCKSAVGVVSWQVEIWNPDQRTAVIGPLFGEPTSENNLGTLQVVKAMIEWARKMGCVEVTLSSSVGATRHSPHHSGFNVFDAIAKRLGMELTKVDYTLYLEDHHGSS